MYFLLLNIHILYFIKKYIQIDFIIIIVDQKTLFNYHSEFYIKILKFVNLVYKENYYKIFRKTIK